MALPTYAQLELKNGMQVFVVEDHALPLVHAALVVRAGSDEESAREAGLAALTWASLPQGAGSMGAAAVAAAAGALGSDLVSTSGLEAGRLLLRLPRGQLGDGLELLATLALKPTFNAPDVERVRARLIEEAARDDGADAIAARVLAQLAYGPEHPYGHAPTGTVASLEKLNAARVKKFWSERAVPRNAALLLVGDVTLDDARALAEKHLGRWKGGTHAARTPPMPQPATAMKIAIVEMPGAARSVIRAGRPLLASSDPDEAAVLVLNEILGAMPGARLPQKLSVLGAAGGPGAFADSSVQILAGPGLLTLHADVPAATTSSALGELVGQLDALAAGGITDDELSRARAAQARGLPRMHGTPAARLDVMQDLFVHALPVEQPHMTQEQLSTIDADAVHRAAERALVRTAFTIVVVGDRKTIEAGLLTRGLTDFVVVNPDGTAAKP